MQRAEYLSKQRSTSLSTVAIACSSKALAKIAAAPKLRRKPVPATSIVNDVGAVVQRFLDAMSPEIGDEPMAFRCWQASYAAMRTEQGWPVISGKTLSMALQRAGCRRMPMRSRGERFIAFQVPQPMEAP